MSTLVQPSATGVSAAPRRRPHLSGLYWLVWRQHRAAFWTLLAATAVAVAGMLYLRAGMDHYLSGIGWPHPKSGSLGQDFDSFSHRLVGAGYYLGFLPILVGVFVGAPLLGADLEAGTARLVLGHSVSRNRWLATKLGMTTLVVVVTTLALSLTFHLWWSPVAREQSVMDWTSGSAFDVTGPVPVMLTLLTVVGGAAIGMVLRRTLAAMLVTFGFAVAVQVVWSRFRLDLGHTVNFTSHSGIANGPPSPPSGALPQGLGPSYLTDSGAVLPWGTCLGGTTEKAQQTCLASKHVVGYSIDYLPISQMSGMQWLGSGILFALTAAITLFIFVRARRRLV